MTPNEMVSVRYLVDDVAAALDFYTKMLDFEVLTSFPPVFADVARGSLRLLLSGPTSSAGRPMPDGAKPGPGGWNRIHLIVDDIEAEVTRLRKLGAPFRNEVAARVAFDILAARPGAQASRVTCPLLVQVCDDDTVAPASRTAKLAAHAPLGEVSRHACGHFDIYDGPDFERVVDEQVAFLKRHVPL